MSSDSANVLAKIARAMQRGTIPPDSISLTMNSVWVELFTHGETPKTLQWYEKAFPGGKHRLDRRANNRSRRTGRRALYWDRWSYSVHPGRCYLTVRYSMPHVCTDFKAFSQNVRLTGDAEQDYPRWFCQACGKDMTITEARRRGLLPPRQASA